LDCITIGEWDAASAAARSALTLVEQRAAAQAEWGRRARGEAAPTPAGDDQRDALTRLADEWEADVERLVAVGTNYDDGAAAQAAHCAARLRIALAARPSAQTVTTEQIEAVFAEMRRHGYEAGRPSVERCRCGQIIPWTGDATETMDRHRAQQIAAQGIEVTP
jgi:hypothetical protein